MPSSSTKPAWLQADIRQTKVISSGFTPSAQMFKKFQSFLSMPMHFTSSKYGIPSLLHAPTFCIHVNQAIPHKGI
jgi:hypothetical protein